MSSSDAARLSVAIIDVRQGREADFNALAAELEALLIRKNYGRGDTFRDEARPLRFYAVRHWNSAESAGQYHADPEVQGLTAQLLSVARVTHVVNGARRGEDASLPRDRRVHVDADRRSGFERRGADRGGPDGERRAGGERRLAARRSSDVRAISDLVTAARAAREHAHAAFSKFKVGAALQTATGAVITGCNVENATYGLTLCAERVAMFKAISDGHRAFARIAIVADTDDPTPPCGACRQILWEFGGDLEVQLANLAALKGTYRLKDLLPLPFDARLL